MIKKEDLKIGSWYSGHGRGSSVALWNGSGFLFISRRFDAWVIKECGHYEDGGCFAPLEEVKELLSAYQYEKVQKGDSNV